MPRQNCKSRRINEEFDENVKISSFLMVDIFDVKNEPLVTSSCHIFQQTRFNIVNRLIIQQYTSIKPKIDVQRLSILPDKFNTDLAKPKYDGSSKYAFFTSKTRVISVYMTVIIVCSSEIGNLKLQVALTESNKFERIISCVI